MPVPGLLAQRVDETEGGLPGEEAGEELGAAPQGPDLKRNTRHTSCSHALMHAVMLEVQTHHALMQPCSRYKHIMHMCSHA